MGDFSGAAAESYQLTTLLTVFSLLNGDLRDIHPWFP